MQDIARWRFCWLFARTYSACPRLIPRRQRARLRARAAFPTTRLKHCLQSRVSQGRRPRSISASGPGRWLRQKPIFWHGSIRRRGDATSDAVASTTGAYFEKSREKKAAPAALDEAAQERLWTLSEQLLGLASTTRKDAAKPRLGAQFVG